MGNGRAVLALDVGGTKLAAAVVTDEGAMLGAERSPTPRTDDAEVLFAQVERLCRGVLAAAPVAATAIGVGCGGPMRYPEGVMSPLNIPAWRAFPLRSRLEAALALPCVVDNDAKAMALGEHWLGAGRGVPNMLGIVVSTGVGGGIIVDGRLLHGHSGNAGHFGHVNVWPDGPRCLCGAHGCVEAVASGTGLVRRLADARAAGAASVVQAAATAADIAVAARAGDPLAVDLMRTAGAAVGRGIASAAALLDLEVAILGGSIALKAWDLIGPPLEAELRRTARLDFTRDVRVEQARLGEAAGVLGAARLAFDMSDGAPA